jgi:hypothetical protein
MSQPEPARRQRVLRTDPRGSRSPESEIQFAVIATSNCRLSRFIFSWAPNEIQSDYPRPKLRHPDFEQVAWRESQLDNRPGRRGSRIHHLQLYTDDIFARAQREQTWPDQQLTGWYYWNLCSLRRQGNDWIAGPAVAHAEQLEDLPLSLRAGGSVGLAIGV